jgi:hypothetical protein
MTLPSQTSTFSDVFTRYAYNKVGGSTYKNQKYKSRPVLKLLREHKLSGDGGPNIVHPVNLGTASNGGSLSRNQTFSIVGDVNETWSRWAWSVIYESCFISWWDIREARGNKFKMASILDTRIDETRENMEDNIETMLCASTAADADDINPILSIVATSGATGGMNPSTAGQTLWRAETEATINWSVEGVGRTRELINKIEDNRGKTDVILLPDQFFNESCEIADAAVTMNQDIKTRGGTKYADLGTTVPIILNVPVIRSSRWNAAQTATGVALDLNGIHLVVDPAWDMYMYDFKEMAHHGRLGQAAVQVCVAQLTCSSRWTQGLLSTIS